ncbi:MAG: magnesium/cobalt transporter CorA [Massilibacteroides sp.]|nr:magnesium/cobalt transporter CorA [Massilibacteroides sp.]MDD3061521.1 magnesium/cobalt transporter CorA [Massilibacteroides sp.]MDD4114816.1 magnesium/cobalt transporter CorA [Massilibacteroides sp.]MDD4659189.1 magnesium/cobalt transporter CorA [Massilibacteroides sp.]
MKHRENYNKRKRSSNHHLSEQYVYTGNQTTSTTLRLIQYNTEGVRDNAIPQEKENELFERIQHQGKAMNWVQVNGLMDAELISRIIAKFGLDMLDAKDILTPEHIVKIEEYQGKIFIILNSCHYNERNEIETEHIGILMVGNTVITFAETNHDLFIPVIKAINEDILGIRSKEDGSMLLAFLLNAVVASLVETSTHVEELLEDIEDTLLDISTNQESVGSLIQQRRREYMVIRKNSLPLREQINKLTKSESILISHEAQPAFIDLTDQLQYVNQTIDGCREIISSLVDLYISNNDLRMNAIMKRLTIVSTLFIPLTFLAGIWGMNFANMPELGWKYGYWVAWGIMGLTGIGTWIYLHKKDWY